MAGTPGTPPTNTILRQGAENAADPTKENSKSTDSATIDDNQPVTKKASGPDEATIEKSSNTGQSTAERGVDLDQTTSRMTFGTSPPATTPPLIATVGTPALSSDTQDETTHDETATRSPPQTSDSRSEAASVISPATSSTQNRTGEIDEAGKPVSITIGSNTGNHRPDLSSQSDRMTVTTAQHDRDIGDRASEAYEQEPQGIWDTAQRSAAQVRQQGSKNLSMAQTVLTENPSIGIMVGIAVGVMIGYLIGQTSASSRRTDTWRYNNRDDYR
jgi:ElaB/YqjD/DUF883 family membrane-anchored ribosome-binding protein